MGMKTVTVVLHVWYCFRSISKNETINEWKYWNYNKAQTFTHYFLSINLQATGFNLLAIVSQDQFQKGAQLLKADGIVFLPALTKGCKN